MGTSKAVSINSCRGTLGRVRLRSQRSLAYRENMTDLEKAFSQIYFLCYFIPVTLAIVGLPLALKRIKPNGTYGFRTSKTLADPEVWYSVNTIGGISFVITGIISIVLLATIQKYWITGPMIKFYVGFTLPLAFLLIAVWVTFKFG